jgi:hypothetical protein
MKLREHRRMYWSDSVVHFIECIPSHLNEKPYDYSFIKVPYKFYYGMNDNHFMNIIYFDDNNFISFDNENYSVLINQWIQLYCPDWKKILGVNMNASCRICKEVKFKLLDKVYKDGTYRYLDQDGLLWEGRVCPQCLPSYRRLRREKKLGKPSRAYKRG